MVKSNVKSLMIILIAIIILASFATISFAANDTGLQGLLLDENTTLGQNTEANNEENNEENIDNTPIINTPPVVNSTQNTGLNQQAELPKTGESDIYVVTLLIVVFATVTIYAYKKIREYNQL